MSELKPCPFCGGEAHKYPYSDKGSHAWMVSCDKSTHRALLSDWNTRPIEDELTRERNKWIETARTYAKNDEYWHERCDELQKKLDDAISELKVTEGVRTSQLRALMANYKDQENTISVFRKSNNDLHRKLNIAVEFIKDMVINDGTHADISILAERTLKKLEER